jgi:hypothetical protein
VAPRGQADKKAKRLSRRATNPISGDAERGILLLGVATLLGVGTWLWYKNNQNEAQYQSAIAASGGGS